MRATGERQTRRLLSDGGVSVIITCYNDAEYVAGAIENALAQEYTPLEVIIVDDGSTDESVQVIAPYTTDPRVRVIRHHENRGLPAARNTAIRQAHGEYIAFLDADDRWLPGKVAAQVAFLRAHPTVGMCYTRARLVTPEGRDLGITHPFSPTDDRRATLRRLFIQGGGGIPPSTVMVRREVFDVVGLFNERLRMRQDRELWTRIAAQFAIARLDEALALKTQRPNSLGANAVRGAEYTIASTEELVRQFPELAPLRGKRLARLYLQIGVAQLKRGNRREARRALWAALRHDPFLAQTYPALILSFLPRSLMERISATKRKRRTARLP
ncbi:MAG: glycosyltransferase [Chloroflexi bacterium]|nr:glycosyltransferase [Chloroflexota bacterium]